MRCALSGENECHGHDCIDRIGTPCIFDAQGIAGLDDVESEPPPATAEHEVMYILRVMLTACGGELRIPKSVIRATPKFGNIEASIDPLTGDSIFRVKR